MAVSLFAGLIGGAILGFATQSNRSKLCDFIRVQYPTLFKSVGLLLLATAVLLPILGLTGVVAVNLTPFFWGGCMVFSFIFGFFTVHCDIMQKGQEV